MRIKKLKSQLSDGNEQVKQILCNAVRTIEYHSAISKRIGRKPIEISGIKDDIMKIVTEDDYENYMEDLRQELCGEENITIMTLAYNVCKKCSRYQCDKCHLYALYDQFMCLADTLAPGQRELEYE